MFEKLFEPLQIGPVRVRNRIQMLPHNTLYTMDRLAEYCAARARGGAGLIEVSLVTPMSELGELPKGPVDAWPYKGYDRSIVPYYRRLSERIHEYGAKVFVQVAAVGANRSARRGVSKIPGGIQRTTAREMSQLEIEMIIEQHAVAARHIRDGGIDGIDLHGTHGMLIEEFYSKATNRRNDKYGGTLQNRIRIIKEIVASVRETTGNELAVGMRIDADDKFPDGNRLHDQTQLATELDGSLDFLNVDIGFEHQFTHLSIAPLYQDPGYQLYASRAIKQVLRKAVVGATGRITDPVLAEQALNDRAADIIGMTRALIADPDLPNKTREGHLDEIRFCLGDNQKCIGNMLRGLPMQCTVNPVVGREGEATIRNVTPSTVRKRVLVIGGGPAGLEVARMCSVRGHTVTLCEKQSRLGGLVNLAKVLPKRDDLISIVRWYEFQLKKLGVGVRLNYKIENKSELIDYVISEIKPDCVVVATGSVPIRNGMQSFNYHPIKGHDFAVTLDDVLIGAAQVGRNVIILDEFGFVEGLSLAEKLCKSGSRVELVTRDSAPGLELQWSLQLPYLYENALRAGVIFTPNFFIEEIGKSHVTLYNIYTQQRYLRENVDTTILYTGRQPNDDLVDAFEGKVKEVYAVGDSNLAGRQIGDNLSEAFDLALTL